MTFQIVITGYGIYVTQGGKLAFIDKSEQRSNGVLYLGYLLTLSRGKAEHEWHTWSIDGHCSSSGRDLDIVEKV